MLCMAATRPTVAYGLITSIDAVDREAETTGAFSNTHSQALQSSCSLYASVLHAASY